MGKYMETYGDMDNIKKYMEKADNTWNIHEDLWRRMENTENL